MTAQYRKFDFARKSGGWKHQQANARPWHGHYIGDRLRPGSYELDTSGHYSQAHIILQFELLGDDNYQWNGTPEDLRDDVLRAIDHGALLLVESVVRIPPKYSLFSDEMHLQTQRFNAVTPGAYDNKFWYVEATVDLDYQEVHLFTDAGVPAAGQPVPTNLWHNLWVSYK